MITSLQRYWLVLRRRRIIRLVISFGGIVPNPKTYKIFLGLFDVSETISFMAANRAIQIVNETSGSLLKQ